jgi:hypothetical protein
MQCAIPVSINTTNLLFIVLESAVRLVYGWLSVCLLLFVGACCLVSVVWRCTGGMYVAGCWSEIGVRIYISLRVVSLMFLR